MKKNIKTLIISLAAITSLTACQDIKDTYADMAGDGEIRYIGKCDNLTVSPGWERLIVNWTNNSDPIIEKVKVKWTNDIDTDSVLLDRGTTTYSIGNLNNSTYEIIVSSLDKDGNESLENTIYSRPYTSQHEEVISFSRVVAKQYFLDNNLIMLFSGWQNGLETAYLKYTKKDGSEGNFELNENIASQPIYVLPDEIDTSKPVNLYRTGHIGSCKDLIEFDPYELSKEPSFTSDFKEFLKTKYGTDGKIINSTGNVSDSWAKNLQTLELDADINSLEDLLNMPNLKRLVVGKNTYLTEAGVNDETRGQYKVFDPAISNKVLEIMHQHTGLVVERYNKHYQELGKESYIKDMGATHLPEIDCYDISQASIKCSVADQDGYNSHPEYLIDGKTSTCWKPFATSSQQTYILTIDLGKEVEASGIKVVQKSFSKSDQDNDIAPQKMTLKIADKSGGLSDATYVEENTLGTSTGQTILLPFANGTQKVRYIQVGIPSQYYFGTFDVTLAEIGLYK